PNFPFQYSFIDERYEQLYQSEHRLGQIFGTFSLLAVFIACLGLFGLASYTAEQRTKEIGVRKALGASLGNIVLLLSKDFCAAGGRCHAGFMADCLLRHEPLAAGICVSQQYQSSNPDFPAGSAARFCHCVDHRQLSIHQSGDDESGASASL
ncbi:MAG: ABC transporter permease, partial [bacterium]